MQILTPSEKSVNAVVAALKRGQVVIVPTDTVYGFLADAKNRSAVAAIFKIKKRQQSKPLSLFVKNMGMAKIFANINKEQEEIIKSYWPGAYTFVLRRNKQMKIFGVDENTVGMRMPDAPFIRDVLKKINRPLAQTSVNISAEEALNSPEEIIKKFGDNQLIALMVNGGEIKNAKASQVMDITNNNINILRQ